MFVRKFRLSSGLSTASLTSPLFFRGSFHLANVLGTKAKPNYVNAYETWACIMSTNIPLATGSHRAKLRVTEGRKGRYLLHWETG